jgi:tRNA threonylcarbamoyl adenosine modification protein YeaZ
MTVAVPLVLAIDTSGPHCAAALLRGEAIVAEDWRPMDTGQAEALIPLCEGVLARAGQGWSDLTAIAVGTGPGNFTGVRIAVAAARGLALGLGIAAVGVTGFEAAAWHRGDATSPCWVVIDARRGQIYLQRLPGGVPHLADAMAEAGLDAPILRHGDLSVAALVRAVAHVGLRKAGNGGPPPAPFYIRSADALPPADPPPVILA